MKITEALAWRVARVWFRNRHSCGWAIPTEQLGVFRSSATGGWLITIDGRYALGVDLWLVKHYGLTAPCELNPMTDL